MLDPLPVQVPRSEGASAAFAIPMLLAAITAKASMDFISMLPARARSLHDRDLAAIDRDGNGQDQQHTEDDLLGEDVDTHERHADAHDRDDQRTDQRAPDA